MMTTSYSATSSSCLSTSSSSLSSKTRTTKALRNTCNKMLQENGSDDADKRSDPADIPKRRFASDKSREQKAKKPNPLISPTEKCKVCYEPAARHIHYGSVTCFSCRAFFRRSIQNKSGKEYICRKDGDCDVTYKGRKNCQKCRFDRCLDAGMKPSWVLSEDERHRRFRKMREKKMQQSVGSTMSPSSSHAEAEVHAYDVQASASKKEVRVNGIHHPSAPDVKIEHMATPSPPGDGLTGADLKPVLQPSTSRGLSAYNDRNPHRASPNCHTDDKEMMSADDTDESGSIDMSVEPILLEPAVEISDDELFQIQRLSQEHDISYKSVPFGEELIKEMVMCSVFGIPLSTTAAMTAYRLMIQRVTKVAQSSGPFVELSHDVQTALLKRNADLLVSLRGAVFFEDKKKGLDQILYSMGVEDIEIGKKLIRTTMKNVGHMGRINYRNFNSLQATDANKEAESRYDQLLARVGAAVSPRSEFVKILSYIILFSPDFVSGMSDSIRHQIEAVQMMFINMLKRFVLSQYSRQAATFVLANILSSIADLQELTHIKKQRALAAPQAGAAPPVTTSSS